MSLLQKITYWLTILVIAFTPLDAIEISEGVTLGRYFFIAMAFFALFSNDLVLKRRLNIFTYLICFIIWASLTAIWSINPTITLQRVLLLIQYAIIFCVIINVIDTPQKLRMAMTGWIIGAVYIAYKTATDFSTYAVSSVDLYRVMKFGNPNENSFMLSYALVFCYLIDKTKYRIPSIALTAFSVYAIVANGSRMGIILFSIAVIAFCIQLWQEKKRWYVLLLVPFILGFGIYILNNIPQATLMRILGITSNLEEGDLANRENIWEAAIYILQFHKEWVITGCGWGTFSDAIYEFLGQHIGAHNFYLDVLVTTGIVGFSIVMIYLYRLFIIIRKTEKTTIMNYLLIVIPLISMMSTNWQSRRWWFLMGAFIYLTYKMHNFIPTRNRILS